MEQQILELIEEEITRRVNLRSRALLEVISGLYEIPVERLIKDTACIEGNFCKGILASKQRCLKTPKENGFCGFHMPGPLCKGVLGTGKPCRRKAPGGYCGAHIDQAPEEPEDDPRLKAPWET